LADEVSAEGVSTPAGGARVALVTGGSAGIGAVIVDHLLERGYEVVSMARRAPERRHPCLHSVLVDLADPRATAEAAAEAAVRFPFTTLVHNAGVIRPALLSEVKLADLEVLTHIHLSSAITLVQHALPAMHAAGFGRIILMSSRGALGLPTRTVYAATKAGMIGMARTWALELAASGITVNVVAPGPIQTDMFWEVIPPGSDKERQVAAGLPVRRIGRPDDVARAVMFFADPLNSFVTGQVLYVCGGASIGGLAL
jgi:NAD(P)-dependent dehydrogenase (short-subunit alcohol dehydrogenase family)